MVSGSTIPRRALLVGGLAGASQMLNGCERGYRVRYRMTVAINFDGSLVEGSCVRELVRHEGDPAWAGMDVSGFNTHGDAVIVDLAPRGLLFATLAYRRLDPTLGKLRVVDDTWNPTGVFERAFGGDHTTWSRRVGISVPLLDTELPILVTFADPLQRTTVREVDPSDLASVFGPSVSLQSIAIEVTHGFVTRGRVRKALPWLKGMRAETLAGGALGAYRDMRDSLRSESFTI